MVYTLSMARRWLSRKGQSMIEAAVAVPILVVLFMGCIQLAQIGLGQIVVMVAAYEAGRQVSMDDNQTANGERVAKEICAAVSSGDTTLSLTSNPNECTVSHHLRALFPVVKNITLTASCPQHLFMTSGQATP
jgi:Flp pilus assembly protein TadG